MAFRKNTNMANAQAEYAGSLYNSGTLEIRTGVQPASSNDVATGALLCSIPLPATAFGTAVNGVAPKAGTWSGIATASGLAGWARFISAANDRRMDVDVTVTGGGGTLTIDDVNILDNGTIIVTDFNLIVPLLAA